MAVAEELVLKQRRLATLNGEHVDVAVVVVVVVQAVSDAAANGARHGHGLKVKCYWCGVEQRRGGRRVWRSNCNFAQQLAVAVVWLLVA